MGMGGNSNGGLNAAATTANPAAGSDIYTVLANMQRNSLSAQQQQRNSPQPGAHVVRSAVCFTSYLCSGDTNSIIDKLRAAFRFQVCHAAWYQ